MAIKIKRNLQEDGEFLVKGIDPTDSKEPKNVKDEGSKDADKEFKGNDKSVKAEVKHDHGKEGTEAAADKYDNENKVNQFKKNDDEGSKGGTKRAEESPYLAGVREKLRDALGISKTGKGLNK
jgi:hypothetical protein